MILLLMRVITHALKSGYSVTANLVWITLSTEIKEPFGSRLAFLIRLSYQSLTLFAYS